MIVKYAVITGASRGLGQHLACRFWDAGYSLGLISRNTASMRETTSRLDLSKGGTCDLFACDLGHPASVQELVAEISAKAAQINVIVNNAAIQGPIGPLEQNDVGDWEQTIRVNLLGPVAICRGLLPRIANAPMPARRLR
jgi:short-subunit dehydrogenase